jgi:polysaccharide export outer membrane protein
MRRRHDFPLLSEDSTVKRIALVLALSLFAGSAAQTQGKPAAAPAASQSAVAEVPEDYVIGIEDVLSIMVWREPDLSVKELVVRPDGKISLPLISDIQAQGLTPKQLQEAISAKLKAYVAAPSVFVTVLKTLSWTVSVVGQVNRPGAIPLGGPLTVLDLIARAGGLSEYASEKNIRILRQENGKTVQYPFNYKDAIRGKNLKQNILLKNGDIVMIP